MDQMAFGISSTVDNNDGTFTLNFSDDTSFTTSDFTGPQGLTGAAGADGADGVDGAQGPRGFTRITRNSRGKQVLQGLMVLTELTDQMALGFHQLWIIMMETFTLNFFR